MPQPNHATGLHVLISNLESQPVVLPEESQGSEGFGAIHPTGPDAGAEDLHVMEMEAFTEGAISFHAPDLTGLTDIGAASFTNMPKLVIGADERVSITDTKTYPWRVSASLLITARDDSQWIGTGWFISPRTLITAGHCVHIKNSGKATRDGWVKKIQVMPGRNGAELPFGAMTKFRPPVLVKDKPFKASKPKANKNPKFRPPVLVKDPE